MSPFPSDDSQIEPDTAALLGAYPVPISDYKEIVLAHGSGGRLSQQLPQRIVIPQFANAPLAPLYVANEGKGLAIVPRESADEILAAMRAHPFGHDAAIIGEVTAAPPGVVLMKTRVGGTRIVDVLSGEQLPRIC